MNRAMTPSAEANELDPAAYNSFVTDLDLASAEIVKVHGERTATGVAMQIKFDLAASYLRDEATIHYRYDLTAHFTDDHETALGNAAASFQLIVRTSAEASAACIEQFGGTSGALMAHPYLREAIASTAQRIGFPGVLLPMITRQAVEPDEL